MKYQNQKLIIEVPVNKGQTLSDVEQIYPLPSGAIIHKKLPGLGATHGEINAPRHSIIVLPNRPVIEMKVAKHNKEHPKAKKILGVYKGITPDEIIAYMSDAEIAYKKILITPEGYADKLKIALADVWDYVKKEFYLLIDECERTIQDKDYRNKISVPFDDFFDFTYNGLISATTLPFSDPRFEALVHYHIQPQYSFVRPLTLVDTNNVLAAFREHINNNQCDTYFIFLSSIATITALIDALGIKSQCKIHCSESRRTTLKMKGYESSSELDTKALAKFNFFTSRFYSGLDVDLPYKADVLLITEVVFAEHSILDPLTEVIQIVGRFRNGTNSIAHITNFNPELDCKSIEEAVVYMEGQRDVYEQIQKLKLTLTSQGAQEAIKEILENTKFGKYFNPDGTYNYFMLDNYIQEQRVLGLYQSVEKLLDGYKLIEDHFQIERDSRQYLLTDKDRLRRQSLSSKKDEIKAVVEQLDRLVPRLDNFVLGGDELLNDLRAEYPVIVEAYFVIKAKGIEECGYLESRIKAATLRAKQEAQLYSAKLLKMVYEKFIPSKVVQEMFTVTTLQDIYDRCNIRIVAKASHIERYFKAQRSTRSRSDNKVYVLGMRLYDEPI